MARLTNDARTILRARVRNNPAHLNYTLDGKQVSALTNAELQDVARALGIALPTPMELQAYARAEADPNATRGAGIRAADAVLSGAAPATPEAPEAPAQDAADMDDDNTPEDPEAPEAPEAEADPAETLAADVRGLLGAGRFDDFNRALVDLARKALTPPPSAPSGPVRTSAPAGTLASMFAVGIPCHLPGADQTVLAKSTALPVHAAASAPGIAQDYLWPEETPVALVALAHGQPVFLFGPAGTGKTTFAEQVAARWGRPFVRINCDDQTDAPTLLGSPSIVTDPATGTPITSWKDGLLTSAIRTPGAVVLVDEPSAARPGALMVLQSVMDGGRVLNIPETGERVPLAADVLVILADNTNGTGDETGAYEGTRRLNRATLDRPDVALKLDYLPPAREVAVVQSATGCPAELANRLVIFAGATREAYRRGDLSHPVGLRRLTATARQIVGGIPEAMAVQAAIIASAPHDDQEILRQIWTVNGQA